MKSIDTGLGGLIIGRVLNVLPVRSPVAVHIRGIGIECEYYQTGASDRLRSWRLKRLIN